MPRQIRYVKDIGTIKKGDVETRSDVDATILTRLGVAEDVVEDRGGAIDGTSLDGIDATFVDDVEEDSPLIRNDAMTLINREMRAERKGKAKKSKKKTANRPETSKGYKRRDMSAEHRK
jgi:hypothetical protein